MVARYFFPDLFINTFFKAKPKMLKKNSPVKGLSNSTCKKYWFFRDPVVTSYRSRSDESANIVSVQCKKHYKEMEWDHLQERLFMLSNKHIFHVEVVQRPILNVSKCQVR